MSSASGRAVITEKHVSDVINLTDWRAGNRPVRKSADAILREYSVTPPRRHDVVGLSRHRQHVRRAMFRADDRGDRAAVALLNEKLTGAEEIERATVPQSEADARQKLITAANEIRAIGPEDKRLAAEGELMLLAKRRITAAHLTRLRVLLARWEQDLEQYPLCGAELVITPLRLALAWFNRPVTAAL
jgi:hypothetical protein